MKMYSLTINSKAYILIKDDELIITADYSKASYFNTAKDAMKAAVEVNKQLGTNLVKVTPVSTLS